MKRFAAFGLLSLLVACAMPSTVVRTSETRPSLSFPDAPEGTMVYVDRERIGEAKAYDGQPAVLIVAPGTHLITLKGRDGSVLFESRVYVESELKTVRIH